MRSTWCLSTLLACAQIVCGQQQPVYPKKSFTDSLGRYFQQASLPVFLSVSNSPDQPPVLLQSVSKKPVTLEGHGVHSFKHLNHDLQDVEEFKIYADGIAPITVATLKAAKEFIAKNKHFFGQGLVLSLRSNDEMSGVGGIYSSVNSEEFRIHSMPDLSKEGDYTFRYYAVDRTGNAEKVKSKEFTIDLSSPTSFHNVVSISSENVISTNSTIYFTVADNASGVAQTYYKFDKENFKPYYSGNIPFQYLNDGDHTLTYYSIDNVGNQEVEKNFKFYLDKTAPIMSADVLGDKFLVGERIYFSGRTKLKLTAIDNKSGIKEVYYTVNDAAETHYTEPFYLPNRAGLHNVKFRAVDNTNNPVRDDFAHSIGVIYVDLTGPSLAHSYIGRNFTKADTVFISPLTKISLSANDPEAGLKKISYALDNDANEKPYTLPITVSEEGFHRLSYYGYDNVNNRNSKDIIFVLDSKGPEIHSQFTVAPSKENRYPSYSNLYLSATDKEVGANEIKYTINGGKEQVYVSPIKGFVKDKEYTIKVIALDLLGNESQTIIQFKTDRY